MTSKIHLLDVVPHPADKPLAIQMQNRQVFCRNFPCMHSLVCCHDLALDAQASSELGLELGRGWPHRLNQVHPFLNCIR